MNPPLALSSTFGPFYRKSIMNRFSRVLFGLWIALAVAAFIGAFFTPIIWIKVINVVFGGLNSLVILSWGLAAIQAKLEYRKHQKDSYAVETLEKE